jgi:hypothetical protein
LTGATFLGHTRDIMRPLIVKTHQNPSVFIHFQDLVDLSDKHRPTRLSTSCDFLAVRTRVSLVTCLTTEWRHNRATRKRPPHLQQRQLSYNKAKHRFSYFAGHPATPGGYNGPKTWSIMKVWAANPRKVSALSRDSGKHS